ncbi:MAG: hypothetical protein KF756_01330 [Acidobacteria bacterium]|nr:hypothetical protein [Acidobacteriota bacterium]
MFGSPASISFIRSVRGGIGCCGLATPTGVTGSAHSGVEAKPRQDHELQQQPNSDYR